MLQVTTYGVERRRTATARSLYDSFCHILHSFSLHLFVSKKV